MALAFPATKVDTLYMSGNDKKGTAMYVPDRNNDFDIAMRAWQHGHSTLSFYSSPALDEFESVSAMLLDMPAHEGDAALTEFADAIATELRSR